MTAREALALVMDPRDTQGDDQAPAGDLVDALIASNIVALSARVARLEKAEREDRSAINRILTRFATEGRPIPPEAA